MPDRRDGDAGFSLVEIMIALTIFAIVAIATAPLLVGGLKAGRAAQLNLQGKALGQERLEQMRNLPFHVARQNGQYLDVLDLYFRDLQPTGALAPADVCAARTYNAATSTYSCRIDALGADYSGFSQVVEAKFLDFQRQTVVPPGGYNSQTAGVDSPVSTLLGVAVTTSWMQNGKTSRFTLRSQLANAQADESALRASLNLSALNITSNLTGGDILQFEAGLISAEGSLTTGSTANLTVATAQAGRATGSSTSGAQLSLTAPPGVLGTADVNEPNGQKLDGTCALVCFGKTEIVGNKDVTVQSGQPQISKPGSQVLSGLRRTGSNVFSGFSYSNAAGPEINPDLRLIAGVPMVSAGDGSTIDVLHGQGFVDGAGTGSTAVRSGGSTRLNVLELFPTDFAPDGIVQIELDASLSCATGGGVGSVSATWSGKVRRWEQTAVAADGTAIGGYQQVLLAPGGALLGNPTTLAVLRPSLTVAGSPNVMLSRWISSWSAMTDPATATTATGPRTIGTIDAVVSVLSAPTRASDPTSALNIAVGALSCVAEDNR